MLKAKWACLKPGSTEAMKDIVGTCILMRNFVLHNERREDYSQDTYVFRILEGLKCLMHRDNLLMLQDLLLHLMMYLMTLMLSKSRRISRIGGCRIECENFRRDFACNVVRCISSIAYIYTLTCETGCPILTSITMWCSLRSTINGMRPQQDLCVRLSTTDHRTKSRNWSDSKNP